MAGHWYDKDGQPCYTQLKADGSGERPTTLRDAKKLQLVPSVTTVMQVAAKPGLEIWKTNQILDAVMESGYCFTESEQEFKRRIISKGKEVGEKAAEKGTKIHDALELWVKTGKVKRGYKKYITAVDECLSCLPDVKWRAEDSFCHPLGFGGKVDLSAKVPVYEECKKCGGTGKVQPVKMGSNTPTGEEVECSLCGGRGETFSHMDGFIIDFKTKATSDKFAVYDEHAMQLAAYGRGLGIPDATCFNLFISTEEEEVNAELVEHSPGDIERGWQMFECLLYYWQLQKKYKPEI